MDAKDITRIEVNTLKAILSANGTLGATDIASKLGIKKSAFSNRIARLEENGLVKAIEKGRQKIYVITKEGRQLLQDTAPEKAAPASASDLLITCLEMLLKESFEETYRFMDCFFEDSFPALSLYYMPKKTQTDAQNSIHREFCDSMTDYISTAIAQNYDKSLFYTNLLNLLPSEHCSGELKGLLHYIAEKYDRFRCSQPK